MFTRAHPLFRHTGIRSSPCRVAASTPRKAIFRTTTVGYNVEIRVQQKRAVDPKTDVSAVRGRGEIAPGCVNNERFRQEPTNNDRLRVRPLHDSAPALCEKARLHS